MTHNTLPTEKDKSFSIEERSHADTQEAFEEGHQAAGEFEDEEVEEYEETTVGHASELIINDEYASLVPTISEQEYQSIKQSIKDDGQGVPIIVTAQRIILDGHTRFRICKELEIVPRIMIRQFEGPLQEKQFIIQINRNRRHLIPFQRVELEAKYQTIQTELAKKRMSEAGKIGAERRWKGGKKYVSEDRVIQNYTTPSNAPESAENTKVKGRVIDISAKNAQVSPATYNKGIKIIKLAPSQETLNKLRTGKVSISKAHGQLEYQKKRQDLLSKGLNSNVKLPDDVKLIWGDFTEKCKDIPDDSIDLILTDPPYAKQDLNLYHSLGIEAARMLKQGGHLVMYAAHYVLPVIFDCMKNSGLEYCWVIMVKHSGPFARVFPKKVVVTYKPLLWYFKGSKPKILEFIRDSVESKPPAKSLHPWAQSTVEAEHVISKLTIPNDVVLDCTMGTGTTGIATLKLKRRFVGIEQNADTFAIARHNISQIISSCYKKSGVT